MDEWICLRCDWSGGDETACPRCRAPLYRVSGITTPREVTPIPRLQPQLKGDPIPSSPAEVQEDDSVPPAVPVAASRRLWVIVGGAIAVAAIWIVATSRFARTHAPTASGRASAVTTAPVDEPPTANPAEASAEEAALGFLDAFAAFDAQKAMTYVTDADLITDGQVMSNAGGLSLWLSRLKAVGYKQTVTSCEVAAFGSDTNVVCDFDFHSLRSDQIGRGPFSGSFFLFTVRDGAIVRVWLHWNVDKFTPEMWEPFAEWASSTYPKDAAVMYLNGTLSTFRLSPASIRLWKRHTLEYVKEVKQGTA